MPAADYGDRVLIYVDILGFKELVFKLEGRERAKLVQLLSVVSSLERLKPAGRTEGHAATAFSDHVIISYPATDSGYVTAIQHAGIVAVVLMTNWFNASIPVGCRGVVTSGPLHHESNIIVGSALIRAYEEERDGVIYPRIVVTEDVAKRLRGIRDAPTLNRDHDGRYFVPFLDVGWVGKAWHTISVERVAIGQLRPKIIEELAQARDERTRAKWVWLARYYNAALGHHQPEAVATDNLVLGPIAID